MGIIDGLLKYYRVETRGDSFESIDMNGALEDVRENLQVKIEENEATISADSVPPVQSGASQLRQVFQTLLPNAMEYSGNESPRIPSVPNLGY